MCRMFTNVKTKTDSLRFRQNHLWEEKMLRKKVIMVTTILAMSISLVGCSNAPSTASKSQSPVPPQTSSSSTALPPDHPTESAQPGDAASQAEIEKKINDYISKNYPGDWKVDGTTLSKGSYTENGNYKIVDGLNEVFPDTMGVSIFVGEERISSSVKQRDRARTQRISTPSTVGDVLKSGKTSSTQSSGYIKVYLPLKAGDKTVAVLTVSVPQK